MIVTCTKCNRHVDCGNAKAGSTVKCRCGMDIMVPEAPASAGIMDCPGCGAPVDPDLGRCTHCDARLATVMCPACFGVVFEGSQHCSHCGEGLTGRTVLRHGDKTKHRCPHCKKHSTLCIEVVAGCPLERCPECEGLWVDRETVERIYKDREKGQAINKEISETSQRQFPKPILDARPKGYIKCPVCATVMNRRNFGRCSGILIDICSKHGTWFDADELQNILQFISSGGLEKAAQREKEELKRELQWLKTKKIMGESSDWMRADGDALGIGYGHSNRMLSGNLALGIAGGILRSLFR